MECAMTDPSRLVSLLQENETWLMERILEHAKRHGYTRYTSTLLEAWRLSIAGLTDSIIQAVESEEELELEPNMAKKSSGVTSFGRLEAQRHRERGVSLEMFLGLFQYYRQTYQELLQSQDLEDGEFGELSHVVTRVFDRIEIAYCDEWVNEGQEVLLEELRSANRRMTNEKNAYLTVFESLSSPVIILDPEGAIRSLNLEAARLLDRTRTPGSEYYRESPIWGTDEPHPLDDRDGLVGRPVREIFSFLPSLDRFFATDFPSRFGFHCQVGGEGLGLRYFDGQLVPMLDVSEKFAGYVITLNDVTERRMLADRLQTLATTDSLTGICNRRHFLDLAGRELTRARRYDRGLSLVVMDVDRFKTINDRFGHAAGDQALKGLASACQEILRASDIMGRLGGEEFGFVFPEVDEKAAFQATERLVAALAANRIHFQNNEMRLTVSAGVSHLGSREDGLKELLSRADRALYEAKKRGRNQAVDEAEL
jgi:diguanylate cyclase (GGDEF)-like protein